jgi:hypothetical protein
MIRFQNGRFYTHGISFTIPNGFQLETEPDFVYEYGLGAWTPDKSCYVEWNVEEGCLGTEKELSDLFQEPSEIRLLSDIQPVSINGLPGYQAAYKKNQQYFFEVRLSLKEKTEFVFLASGREEHILSWKDSPDLQKALNGVKPE